MLCVHCPCRPKPSTTASTHSIVQSSPANNRIMSHEHLKSSNSDTTRLLLVPSALKEARRSVCDLHGLCKIEIIESWGVAENLICHATSLFANCFGQKFLIKISLICLPLSLTQVSLKNSGRVPRRAS